MTTDLLLIPTRIERELLELSWQRQDWQLPDSVAIELCGFGPVVSAARTSQLIARLSPSRVILLGIAGVYPERGFGIGDACEFSDVAIDGLGAGSGSDFVSSREMGFPQWPGKEGQRGIDSELTLAPLKALTNKQTLLTVCSAAGNRQEVEFRCQRFPAAVGEDMEGFGVAAACYLAGIPGAVIRGFSNLAGDRNKANWRIQPALDAVASRLMNRFCR